MLICAAPKTLLLSFAWAALMLPATARAEDWRYCYVGADERHIFQMSRAFRAEASLHTIEEQFVGWLRQQGLPDEAYGCPRSGSRIGIETVMRDAADYNTHAGRTPSDLDWPALAH